MTRTKVNLDELRAKAKGHLDEARRIADEARAEEGRPLTAEEQTKWNTEMGEARRLGDEVDREEMILEAEKRYEGLPAPVVKPQVDKGIGMEAKDVRGFSLLRAVRAIIKGGDWREAQLEKEASDATAKNLGREPRSNGFFIPSEVMGGVEQRDLTIGTEGTDIRAVDFGPVIELLRNKMVTRAAGIRILTNLRGDFQFPKHTAATTNAAWVSEGSAPTEGVATFGQVKITPKQLICYTDLTRQTILQTSFDVENFIRDDLATTLAVELDRVVLHGSGSGSEPTGIITTSGIGDVAGGTNGAIPTWANIVQLETLIAVANADQGSLAYVSNPAVRGLLKKTERVSSTGLFVWQDPANLAPATPSMPVNGYPAFITNQVSSTLTKGSRSDASAIFFGNWSEAILGLWSGVEILVDPYSNSNAGLVRLVAFANADVGIRHAASFAAMKDALVV